MVMSANTEHIKGNFEATKFNMEAEDYQNMTNFRPPGYTPPEVDWEDEKTIVSLITVINDFKHKPPSNNQA